MSHSVVKGRISQYLFRAKTSTLQSILKRGSLWRILPKYIATVLLLAPIDKIYWRCMRSMRMRWISHTTCQFLKRFLEAQCLQSNVTADQQPDQRIADDVGMFVNVVTMLLMGTFNSIIQLYFTMTLLREIAPTLPKTVCACALVGTVCASSLGRSLSRLFREERAAVADFRSLAQRAI